MSHEEVARRRRELGERDLTGYHPNCVDAISAAYEMLSEELKTYDRMMAL